MPKTTMDKVNEVITHQRLIIEQNVAKSAEATRATVKALDALVFDGDGNADKLKEAVAKVEREHQLVVATAHDWTTMLDRMHAMFTAAFNKPKVTRKKKEAPPASGAAVAKKGAKAA